MDESIGTYVEYGDKIGVKPIEVITEGDGDLARKNQVEVESWHE